MIQFVFLLALATAKPIEDDGFAYKYFSHQPNFFYHSQPSVRFNTVAVPTQSFVSYKTSPSFYSTFGAVRRNNVAHVAAPVVNVRTAPVRPVVSSVLTPVVKTTNHFVQVERKPQVTVKSFGLPPVQLTPIKVRDDSADIESVAIAQKQPVAAPAVMTYNAPKPVFRGITFPVVKPFARPTYYSHVTVSDDENSDEDDNQAFRYHSPKVASFRSAVSTNPHAVVYSTDDDNSEEDDNQAFRYNSPSVASFRSAVSTNPHAVFYSTDDDNSEEDDNQAFRYNSPSVASFRSAVSTHPNTVVYSTDDDNSEEDDNQGFRYNSPTVATFRSAVSNNPHAVFYSTDDDNNDDDSYFRSAFDSSLEFDNDKRKKRSTDDDDDDDDDDDIKVVLKSGRIAKTYSVDTDDDNDDDGNDDVQVVLKSGQVVKASVEDNDDDDDDNSPVFIVRKRRSNDNDEDNEDDDEDEEGGDKN